MSYFQRKAMSPPKSGLWVTNLLVLSALGAVFFLHSTSADENQQDPPSEKAIADLIRQLGDDAFARRENAHKALVQIGMAALEPLRKAVRDTTDVEVRRRASEIINQIDPGGARRAELEGVRATLRKDVESVRGVDVKNWAESIANPFSELLSPV
jgi:hypothetical protein